jgi:hypothetical protein
MLNGGFKEAGLDSLRLSKVNPDAFYSFFYWLNSGLVYCKHGATKNDAYPLWTSIVQAYIFADFHGVQGFKNALLDHLYLDLESATCVPIGVSSLIYPNTTETDQLRKFFLDMSTEAVDFKGAVKADIDYYDKEFLFDMLTTCRDQSRASGTAAGFRWVIWTKSMRTHFCERYHIHPSPQDQTRPDAA